MTFPNFPQNNWTINQQPIIYHPKNKFYWLVFGLGVVSGVLVVHFIIDSHKVAVCNKDNSIFECFVAKGEIAVKLKKDLTVDPVCDNLQKNYLGCLPEILWTSAFPEQALANKRAEKAAKEKRQKPAKKFSPRDESPEECWGDNCPPW